MSTSRTDNTTPNTYTSNDDSTPAEVDDRIPPGYELPDMNDSGKFEFGEIFFFNYVDSMMKDDDLTDVQKQAYASLLFDLGKDLIKDMLGPDVDQAVTSSEKYLTLQEATEKAIIFFNEEGDSEESKEDA